ncbi:MAG: NUDIX hydrolase [Sarcina sp.]
MNYIDMIKNYKTETLAEISDKTIILELLDKFDDLLFRENKIAHFTSSAFAVNKEKNKALMIHHNIFDSWSFTGGHTDGDPNVINVALRELEEESGVKHYKLLSSTPISLDIIHVKGHMKNGNYVSPHLHLSFSFLVEVDENDKLTIKEDENSNVAWIPLEKLNEFTYKEPHMQVIFNKIITRISNLK